MPTVLSFPHFCQLKIPLKGSFSLPENHSCKQIQAQHRLAALSQQSRKLAEIHSAVHKIIFSTRSALKSFISAAGVLISPRWLTQPLSVGVAWLSILTRPLMCLKEVQPLIRQSLLDAQLYLHIVLAKAWQWQCLGSQAYFVLASFSAEAEIEDGNWV